jgi:hypothetical protein
MHQQIAPPLACRSSGAMSKKYIKKFKKILFIFGASF